MVQFENAKVIRFISFATKKHEPIPCPGLAGKKLLIRQNFGANFNPHFTMSKGKNQHVVKHPDGWAVKGAGNSKATKVTSTQKEAITAARVISKNQSSELLIHGMNGRIREKNSHGNDPRNIKG
ncbi:DUF2188 domain-containing protein [Litoribacter populi]|uniref:DUF2188 domain-containing protein n=1 Tax=Litoribacter populi TaxID=2598460 RepID=UPI001F1CFFCE|nr:DUF2188 domain-containing protein [Litoribacter populi]